VLTPDAHLDALCRLCRTWVEALLRRTAPSKELVEGAPRSRYQVAAADVVRLLAEAGRPDAATLDADAEQRWHELANAPASLPLPRLVRTFALDDIEARIVVALAAPEHDPEVERLYTYAWDDFTRKRPDVGFLIDLLGGGDPARRARVRRALLPEGALRRWRLVMIGGTSDAEQASPRRRSCRLADRALAHLVEDHTVDPALDGVARWLAPAALDELVMSPEIVALARRALTGATRRVLLRGPAGIGKSLLVRGLATELSRPIFCVDVAELVRAPDALADRLARGGRGAPRPAPVVVLSNIKK
jgi:hypothetical protein